MGKAYETTIPRKGFCESSSLTFDPAGFRSFSRDSFLAPCRKLRRARLAALRRAERGERLRMGILALCGLQYVARRLFD